jgi:hypothetical protein
MRCAEIIFFMRPGEEEATELFLSLFQTSPVDQAIIDTAGGLYRKWHPIHGIDIHDAILASTAIHSSGKIFTLNKKTLSYARYSGGKRLVKWMGGANYCPRPKAELTLFLKHLINFDFPYQHQIDRR